MFDVKMKKVFTWNYPIIEGSVVFVDIRKRRCIPILFQITPKLDTHKRMAGILHVILTFDVESMLHLHICQQIQVTNFMEKCVVDSLLRKNDHCASPICYLFNINSWDYNQLFGYDFDEILYKDEGLSLDLNFTNAAPFYF